MSSTVDSLVAVFDGLVRRGRNPALLVRGDSVCRVTEIDSLAGACRSVVGERFERPALVGLLAPNGPGFIASLIALRRLGLIAVLLDYGTIAIERRTIAERLGLLATLKCRRAWPKKASDWSLEIYSATSSHLDDTTGIAVVKLTSGSGGEPRGVAVRSSSLLADDVALRTSMGIRPDDRILATVPFSHSYGFSSLVLPCLTNGNLLVLPTNRNPLAALEAGSAAAATIFPTVPTFLSSLNRLPSPPAMPASLGSIISAGAPLASSVSAAFQAIFGRRVHVFYGASECGGITYDHRGGGAERGTVGEPIAGVELDLVPLETDFEAEPEPDLRGDALRGSPWSTVRVRSAAVADAYLPEGGSGLGNGEFQSRDLATWSGSELALRGRLDDLLNFRGRKFHPAEVERVLVAMPGVDEASVFGVPDTDRAGEMRIVAVIASSSETTSAQEAACWCRERLSSFKVPRLFRIVERLPRTPRGKIDGHQLAELVD